VDLGLRGKVAVVTGASSGIGLAVAHGFAAEGVDVVVAARGEDRLRAAAEEVAARHGRTVTPVVCDVSTAGGVEQLVSAVLDAHGGADILVDNAGTGSNETVLEAADERWQAYWDLHVMAAVRLARALAPGMAERGGGAIVHNASVCAVQPLGYEPVYNVTKAALRMFSKSLSTELVPLGIRVNCVNPGLVLTPDWARTAKDLTADSGGDWEGHLDAVAKEHAPIGRFADPAEVADLVVWLASVRSSYVVGATLAVDGGMHRSL